MSLKSSEDRGCFHTLSQYQLASSSDLSACYWRKNTRTFTPHRRPGPDFPHPTISTGSLDLIVCIIYAFVAHGSNSARLWHFHRLPHLLFQDMVPSFALNPSSTWQLLTGCYTPPRTPLIFFPSKSPIARNAGRSSRHLATLSVNV